VQDSQKERVPCKTMYGTSIPVNPQFAAGTRGSRRDAINPSNDCFKVLPKISVFLPRKQFASRYAHNNSIEAHAVIFRFFFQFYFIKTTAKELMFGPILRNFGPGPFCYSSHAENSNFCWDGMPPSVGPSSVKGHSQRHSQRLLSLSLTSDSPHSSVTSNFSLNITSTCLIFCT
jgi:hypothetical protein